jgi:hypothetical protein
MNQMISRTARPSNTIALALLGLVMLAASPARAHEDPPGCNETGASINVAIFRDAAATIPLSGAVSPCEIVYYRALLTKAQPQQPGDTVCAFSGAQFDFRTPDGNLTVVSANVPCIGATVGSVPESCVAGLNAIVTPIIQYTVNPADVVGGLISALSTYGFAGGVSGVAHDGAVNTPGVAQATPKQTAVLSCDDANACTADVCDQPTEHGAAGCSHTAVVCNDGNACTADGCDPATGCFHTDISAQCDDQSACTTDTCNAETGCVHTPIACDDANACTGDSCDPASGCVHTPIVCQDNNACTGDSCDPASGCVHTPIVCQDNNACTTDSTADNCDPATGCTHTPIVCQDNNACTADSCDPETGCVHTPIVCQDNNACTADSTADNCDPETGCVHTPIVCNDGNACTTDGCTPATGCTHSAIVCNDGNACTTDGCTPATGCTHSAVVCNDGNACTTDGCGEDGTCQSTPIQGCVPCETSAQCDDEDRCTTDTCSEGVCGHQSIEGCGIEVCTDGVDNDGDGDIDCADSDCADDPSCKVEICDNCIDDDGDGLVDYEDDDCCDQTASLNLRRMRVRTKPQIGKNRLRIKARYAAQAPADFDPGLQVTTLELRDGDGNFFCEQIPFKSDRKWRMMGKFMFRDKTGLVAGGLRRALFKIQKKKNNRVIFKTRGRKMPFRDLVGNDVTVTLAVGNLCTQQTVSLKTKKVKNGRALIFRAPTQK